MTDTDYDPKPQAEYLERVYDEGGWEGVAYYVHRLVTDNVDAVLEDERLKLGMGIVNSEPFMWLMVGSNHTETQLAALRPAWYQYRALNGGWGRSR